MLTYLDYLSVLTVVLDRPELLDDPDSVRHQSLAALGFDSLDVVLLGASSLDFLPAGVQLADELTQSIGDTTLGELYHFIAATLDRTASP